MKNFETAKSATSRMWTLATVLQSILTVTSLSDNTPSQKPVLDPSFIKDVKQDVKICNI